MTIAPGRPEIYRGTRIPSPIPTVLQVDPALREDDDILQVNFGPNHPSTHGVLRLIVDLDGENVVGLAAVIGYLHTGFEKNMEQKTWWKAITYPERIDYVSFQNNELAFVLAIEKLLGVERPAEGGVDADAAVRAEPRCTRTSSGWRRALSSSGAISMFWYCFRERERILDLFELSLRRRACTRATSRPAGSPRTSRAASSPSAARSRSGCPGAVDEYETMLDRNAIWLERTKGSGC